MKNDTNIYDIDGKLLRAAGDNKKLTLEEAKKRIEEYKAKLEELDDNDKKASVYTTYIRNLTKYIFDLYANMSSEELTKQFVHEQNNKALEEQVKEAIEDLKKELDDGETEESHNDEVSGTTAGSTESITDGESGNDQAIERSISDVHEEGPRTQSDFLVERADVTNNMDEYVDFEEVSE